MDHIGGLDRGGGLTAPSMSEHALTFTTNPNGEAEGIYPTANRNSGPDQRNFMGLKPIALGIAYLGVLYGFVQVRDTAYKDCSICTMSFAVAFVLSALIMAGVILSTDAGRHEINFVLLQVHNILLIFAFVSGMPLMFRPIKDKYRMLFIVWFIYFVIVAVAHYQKILSLITLARDRLYSEEVKSVMNLAKGLLICRCSEQSLPQHSIESEQTNNWNAAVVCNGDIKVKVQELEYDTYNSSVHISIPPAGSVT